VSRWLAIACAAAVLLIAGTAAADEPSASLPDIEDEVMCPICGTALNLSEAPQADRQREFIRRRIDEGMSKEEIKDALVAEYGRDVLATPATSGFDLTAWVVPAAAILFAGGALAVGIGRWRRAGGGSAPPASADGPDAGERERLDADLNRYDL
jgi:cytochrome c-type biogenesis protein CcmH